METKEHFLLNTEIDELISRYINDHSDCEAILRLTAAAKVSEADREYIRKKFDLWFATAPIDESVNDDDAFSRFEQSIGMQEETHRQKATIRRMWWISAAVAVTLLVFLPWAGYQYAKHMSVKSVAAIKVESPQGCNTVVTLPDGTKVWLNASSQISYFQNFGIENRTLQLSGEACFDVTHNEELPFIVKTESATLRVLGTKFTYRDYSDDNTMVVDLIRGNVVLENNKTGVSMNMLPQERVTINKQTSIMSKTAIDTRQSDCWTRGELFFDETPMRLIAKELTRHYGIKVEVSGSLGNETFYGSFDTRQCSLEKILSTLSETKRMRFKYVQGRYILY